MLFRRYRRPLDIKVVLLCWLGVVVLIFFGVDAQLRPMVKKVAGNQARVYATKAINNSVATTLVNSNHSYDDFIHITYDEKGKVAAVATDAAALNMLATEVTDEANRRIAQLTEQKISIPIGTLVGNQLVSGRGPRINFKVLPVGFVESKLFHSFGEAGINQTRHQIVLEITSSITAVLPGYSTYATVTTSVTLADTVIVGVSPEAFTKVITAPENLQGDLEDFRARPRTD